MHWPRSGFPALLVGMLGALQLPLLPPWWALLLAAILGTVLLRWAGELRAAGIALLAATWLLANGQWRTAEQWPDSLDGSVIEAVVRVDSLPRWHDRQWRFDALVMRSSDSALAPGTRLGLRWYRRDPLTVAAGEAWALRLRLQRPEGAREAHRWPDSVFDLRANRAGQVRVIADAPAWRVAGADGLLAWRERVSARVAAAVPGHAAAAVQALVIGDTRALTDDDWALLRATGLTHLFAISGFHVALVGLAGVWALRALYALFPAWGATLPRGQGEAVAALLGAAAYTVAVGFALPTMRTLCMVFALVLLRLRRRPLSLWPALAFSLTALLIVDPLAVLSPGFWLSGVGVGLLLWGLSGPSRRPVRDFLLAQGWVSLGLLPVLAVFFGEWSLCGPLVNLVAVPLVSLVIVPCCLLGLGLDLLGLSSSSGTLWQGAGLLLDGIWRGMDAMARWPSAVLPLAPGVVIWAFSVLGISALLLPGSWRRRLAGSVLCLPLLLGARDRGNSPVRVQLLDVADGQAVVLSSGSEHWLLDAGRDPRRDGNAVVVALRAAGVPSLTGVVITRDEPGRRGAVAAVRDAYPLARIIEAGQCQAGVLHDSDAVGIVALHPPRWFPALGRESHCVLRIQTPRATLLLPGDIGPLIQARLRREHGDALRADLLVLPRRGQLDAATLAAVGATTVLRSDRGSGVRTANLAGVDTLVWRTTHHGGISVQWPVQGAPRVTTAVEDHWRWWQHR